MESDLFRDSIICSGQGCLTASPPPPHYCIPLARLASPAGLPGKAGQGPGPSTNPPLPGAALHKSATGSTSRGTSLQREARHGTRGCNGQHITRHESATGSTSWGTGLQRAARHGAQVCNRQHVTGHKSATGSTSRVKDTKKQEAMCMSCSLLNGH